ncbi:MAG TPA: glycosyl hydrolase family 28-related protein [Pyrinomonadaceae bacterium]|jgi:hypothetical protein|nr:glycosyl hydrolase family 28-related protein [Pyrinomonadaceae bacterium]
MNCRIIVLAFLLMFITRIAIQVNVSRWNTQSIPPESSSPVSSVISNVRDFGAKGDGISDDTSAINSAQRSLSGGGGTVYFPEGTYAIGGNGILLQRSDVIFKGAGMWASTLRKTVKAGPIIQSSAMYAGLHDVAFENLAFDHDYPAQGKQASPYLVLYGDHVRGGRVTGCRFWNPLDFGVMLLDGAGNFIIEDSLFHSPGNAQGGGVYLGRNPANITVRRNRFLYLENGILVATRDAANQLKYSADSITVQDNYFDSGWWLLKEKFTGEGDGVSYTATGLFDKKARFSDIKADPRMAYHNVRVMPVKQRGEGKYSATDITDSKARFITNKVRRGDIVRARSAFAVVSIVVSETVVNVEEWMTDAAREPIQPPANGVDYTVYGVYLGSVWNLTGAAYTSTSIRSHTGWWDLDGHRVVPPMGTRYEVLVRRPNYPLNADYGTRNITVRGNTFKRGWSDQISIYAYKDAPSNAVVTDNIVEDGEDMGITVHGKNNYVANNIIRHQGCGGIWTSADDSRIENNKVYDSQWVNMSDLGCGDIKLETANRTTVADNYCERISAIDRWGITVWSGSAFRGLTDSNIITGNTCRNHQSSDIGLIASFKGGVTNSILYNNTGKVVIRGATGTLFRPKTSVLKPRLRAITRRSGLFGQTHPISLSGVD